MPVETEKINKILETNAEKLSYKQVNDNVVYTGEFFKFEYFKNVYVLNEQYGVYDGFDFILYNDKYKVLSKRNKLFRIYIKIKAILEQ